MPIEPLKRSHSRDNFNCGEPQLNHYIKAQALQHRRYGYSDTFVLVDEGSEAVKGYCTIGLDGVDGSLFPDDVNVPRLTIPVILLGKLAVDIQYQGQGLGEELLLYSLGYAVDFRKRYPCYAVCLDALNDHKRQFYAKYGFASLTDNPLHMFLQLKTIQKLGLA